MQPQIGVTLALCEGTSMITESIFENRFKYLDELARMGANVRVEGNTAIIKGVRKLNGANLKATDLRGGAAMITWGIFVISPTMAFPVMSLPTAKASLPSSP